VALDVRCSFVSVPVPLPSLSVVAASSFTIRSTYCTDKICSHITGRCISVLWLLEKLFNYWKLLRRGITATSKRFLRMIGCNELTVPSRLMMLGVSASLKLNVSRIYRGATVSS
jgi:hypothetical protein